MCISGNAADKIPAVICNEVSLVKVLADAAKKCRTNANEKSKGKGES